MCKETSRVNKPLERGVRCSIYLILDSKKSILAGLLNRRHQQELYTLVTIILVHAFTCVRIWTAELIVCRLHQGKDYLKACALCLLYSLVMFNEKEVGLDWYQLIHFGKLSCRRVSFSSPKGTPSREEHKVLKSFSQHFEAIPTGWVHKHYSLGLILHFFTYSLVVPIVSWTV